jgi:hypothetical protein
VNLSKDPDLRNYDDLMRYHMEDLSLSTPRRYTPCAWNSNWLLNVIASADCVAPGEDDGCDVPQELYSTLRGMSRRKDTFSVMGFVSKFFRVCKRLEKRRVKVKAKGKRSTQTPKVMESESKSESDEEEEAVDEEEVEHEGKDQPSYSAQNTRTREMTRTSGLPKSEDSRNVGSTIRPSPANGSGESARTKTLSIKNALSISTTVRSVPQSPASSSPSPPLSSRSFASSTSASSYVERYLNEMDELVSPKMVRYRLGIMFNDLTAAANSDRSDVVWELTRHFNMCFNFCSNPETPRSSSSSQSHVSNVVDRMCRTDDRSKAFVINHMRDVVYASDLEEALRISLGMWGRPYHNSRQHHFKSAADERRNFVMPKEPL